MEENSLKLTIKQIADLKEGRRTLQEITKTHDGTSMGGLRSNIQNFKQKYATANWKHIISYDENGNVVNHSQLTEFQIEYLKIPSEVYNNNKNMDLISNLGHEDLTASAFGVTDPVDYEDKYSGFDILDYDQLIQRNKDGDYVYKSVTTVSPNGSSLTLIKNNKFSIKDEKKYQDLTRKMHYDLKDFVKKCQLDYEIQSARLGYINDDESLTPWEKYKKKSSLAMQYTIERNGTLYEYIKKQGYSEMFEKECNIKLRMRSANSNS